jgi:hypothetical protein
MEIFLTDHFSSEQESLLEMHSVLNIMGIITYQLPMLQSVLGENKALEELIEENADLGKTFSHRDEAICLAGNVSAYIGKVRSTLTEAATKKGLLEYPEFQRRMKNLNSFFEISEVRAAEIMAREQASSPWAQHEIADLKQSFFNVFKAIERNIHGGYRIVYNVAEHFEGDYLINLEIDGEDEH